MATYTLISSNVLASSAASVTFSSIPATYTDLVLRISARSATASATDQLVLTFNSDSGANYSITRLYGNGATAVSSSSTVMLAGIINASTTTASTFSNTEIYIPNYLSKTSKPMSTFSAQENNTTTGIDNVNAMLYRNTSALTSIVITNTSATNFDIGSSFYLYGISNA